MNSTETNVNRKSHKRIADVNKLLLGNVIGVHEPFNMAAVCSTTDKYPSIHRIVPKFPTKIQLSKHLSKSSSDSSIISQLKNHLHELLYQYFTITPLHFTAELLDPKLDHSFTVISADDHALDENSLRQLINRL
jgi:hypothetical protein